MPGEVIKCTCKVEYTLKEAEEFSWRCKRGCRKPLVMKNTAEVKELDTIERIKQQQNILSALTSPGLSQQNRDLLSGSLGLIALTNNSYSVAQTQFKKMIDENPDNPEAYYYYCLSLLNGKRPFLSSRSVIDQIIQYLNFAFAIDCKGKYCYLKALMIQDFYKNKFINYAEKVPDVLAMANALGVDELEKLEVLELLNIKRPAGF